MNSNTQSSSSEFLTQAEEVIGKHISNENFGVSELAEAMNMSRSNLLRKIKKDSDLSASQFIRQIRLAHALELLQSSDLNVSQVAYETGFSSSSYFIKCFREQYGYSPGEAGLHREQAKSEVEVVKELPAKRNFWWPVTVVVVAILALAAGFYFQKDPEPMEPKDKSIAVLPFLNESTDTTNVYLINGLMLSVLNNLQKIEDLKVVSRTSAERYRNSDKSLPEIAEELGVAYIVEGSGQKVGNQVLLNVQLIDAAEDRQLWAEQYSRQLEDIFHLQSEVAKNITDQIEVVVTPEEEARIVEIPTDNPEAYDHFLKGLNLLSDESGAGLEGSIVWFDKAIALDPGFALAYACKAQAYYYLDVFKDEKNHLDELGTAADKALLYDNELSYSLMAKAMYYLNAKEYEEALPYLEKAHEYHPGSARIINMLSDFYTNYSPDAAKYLEYALKGARLNTSGIDSTATSYIYLHLSNALIQNGFIDEALKYSDMSLIFNSENHYSVYLRAYIRFAKDKDYNQLTGSVKTLFEKDTTKLDVVQELAKIYYMQQKYDSAYKYYHCLLRQREAYHLTGLFVHEQAKMAFVARELGHDKEAEVLIQEYKTFADKNESIYQPLILSYYYLYRGETESALREIERFSEADNYFYWVVMGFDSEPIDQRICNRPEFQKAFQIIKVKFWKRHQEIRDRLQEEGLI